MEEFVNSKPKPVLLSALQKTIQLNAPRGQEWCIFTYALNRDMITPEGTVEKDYGVIIPLGSYGDYEQAVKKAKKIIETTGNEMVMVARYACAVKLTTEQDVRVVEKVNVDTKGKLVKLDRERYEKDKEIYEESTRRERELMEEINNECDIEHIEYFKRQCYMAIKYEANIKHKREEMENSIKEYEKIKNELIRLNESHPEYKNEWLEMLKGRLVERGESELYKAVEEGYNRIKDELFENVK